MKAEELKLAEPARTASADLEAAFPFVMFTSGRRTIEDQARAMAQNVAVNRLWIEQTYVRSLVASECQAWVSQQKDASDLAWGLAVILHRHTDAQLAHLSKHLSGEAFDVEPIADPEGQAVKDWLYARAAACGGKFLEREGGLCRWHWECCAPDAPVTNA